MRPMRLEVLSKHNVNIATEEFETSFSVTDIGVSLYIFQGTIKSSRGCDCVIDLSCFYLDLFFKSNLTGKTPKLLAKIQRWGALRNKKCSKTSS